MENMQKIKSKQLPEDPYRFLVWLLGFIKVVHMKVTLANEYQNSFTWKKAKFFDSNVEMKSEKSEQFKKVVVLIFLWSLI